MSTIHLRVPGMTCGHCVAAVDGEIRKVPGVSDVVVDLESKDVLVTGERVELDALVAAVDEAGYEASAAGTGTT